MITLDWAGMRFAHSKIRCVAIPVRTAERKLFGRQEYTLLRADPGRPHSAILGHNMNPFGGSRRPLRRRAKTQRDEAKCVKCQTHLFEKRALDTEGGYFVEHRSRLMILGIPIREKITDVTAYCPTHKPTKESIR